MNKLLLLIFIAVNFGIYASADTLQGAGSSSSSNLMNDFTKKYNASNPQQVVYHGSGPADGFKKIKAKQIDFAISVVPILPFELKQEHLVQFPLLVLGFVIAINVPGVHVGDMVLNGDVLAEIFRGKIQYWDDTSIQKLNPKLNLPHINIVPIYRSDPAGSTFAFTNYLSKVNLLWLLFMGDGFTVDWPSGQGGVGGEGVAKKISTIPGSIGYIELSTAIKDKLIYVDMFNRAGARVRISRTSLQSAVDDADFKDAEDYYIFFTNQGGAKSWPLLAGSYVLMRSDTSPAAALNILKFFHWCFVHSHSTAMKIGAIELPPSVVTKIELEWNEDFGWTASATH
jgi:phosphate transport system substrate-binding protein